MDALGLKALRQLCANRSGVLLSHSLRTQQGWCITTYYHNVYPLNFTEHVCSAVHLNQDCVRAHACVCVCMRVCVCLYSAFKSRLCARARVCVCVCVLMCV
jgi:hypothetical protein